MILDEIVAKRKEQLARELQRTDRETMRKLDKSYGVMTVKSH